MISPWTVYFVMQADAIGGGLAFLFCVLIILTVAALIYQIENNDDDILSLRSPTTRMACFTAFIGVLALFTPSTKTAAAMILIPAMTSDEVVNTIRPEFQEIYELAKDALREAAGKKK